MSPLLLALIAGSGSTPPPDPDPDPDWTGPLHPGVTATRVGTGGPVTDEKAMSEDITKVGETYWLLYTNWGTDGLTRMHLGSSSSPDGPWTAWSGNPVLTTGGPGESSYTNGGSIIFHEGTFYFYYCWDGTGGAIGVATAPTITGPYTKHGKIVDVGPSGAWDSRRVQEPHVVRTPEGLWVMAYMAEKAGTPTGSSEQCGIATAPDPLGPWTKSPANPVLPYGPDGAWDGGGTADPSLYLEDDGTWWMLYSGLSEPSGQHPWQLGLAYADGPHGPWTRIPHPVLPISAPGGWDDRGVWRGAIYKEDGVYYLPYGGFATTGVTGSVSGARGGAARIIDG